MFSVNLPGVSEILALQNPGIYMPKIENTLNAHLGILFFFFQNNAFAKSKYKYKQFIFVAPPILFILILIMALT